MWLVPARFKVKTIKTEGSENHTVHTNYKDWYDEHMVLRVLLQVYINNMLYVEKHILT